MPAPAPPAAPAALPAVSVSVGHLGAARSNARGVRPIEERNIATLGRVVEEACPQLDEGDTEAVRPRVAASVNLLNESGLEELQGIITARKVRLQPDDARALARRAVLFKQQHGRLPELTARAPPEQKLAERVAVLVQWKRNA